MTFSPAFRLRNLSAALLAVMLFSCKRNGDDWREGTLDLARDSIFRLHVAKDSMIFPFCSDSGHFGFDQLRQNDTVGIFVGRFLTASWTGAIESLSGSDEMHALRVIPVKCPSQLFPVAILNPTSGSFEPIDLDTIPDIQSLVDDSIWKQARELRPDSVDLGNGQGYREGWYTHPPRGLRRRFSGPSASILLQFGCDTTSWCGPAFLLYNHRLLPLEGHVSGADLKGFQYKGQDYIHMDAGLPNSGNVWRAILQWNADTAWTVAVDARFAN